MKRQLTILRLIALALIWSCSIVTAQQTEQSWASKKLGPNFERNVGLIATKLRLKSAAYRPLRTGAIVRELALSDKQQAEISKILSEEKETHRDLRRFGLPVDIGSLSESQMMDAIQKIHKNHAQSIRDYSDRIHSKLATDQKDRLKQIYVQQVVMGQLDGPLRDQIGMQSEEEEGEFWQSIREATIQVDAALAEERWEVFRAEVVEVSSESKVCSVFGSRFSPDGEPLSNEKKSNRRRE